DPAGPSGWRYGGSGSSPNLVVAWHCAPHWGAGVVRRIYLLDTPVATAATFAGYVFVNSAARGPLWQTSGVESCHDPVGQRLPVGRAAGDRRGGSAAGRSRRAQERQAETAD